MRKSHRDQKHWDLTLLIALRYLNFPFQKDCYGKFVSYHHQTIFQISCLILQIILKSTGVMAALLHLLATAN